MASAGFEGNYGRLITAACVAQVVGLEASSRGG